MSLQNIADSQNKEKLLNDEREAMHSKIIQENSRLLEQYRILVDESTNTLIDRLVSIGLLRDRIKKNRLKLDKNYWITSVYCENLGKSGSLFSVNFFYPFIYQMVKIDVDDDSKSAVGLFCFPGNLHRRNGYAIFGETNEAYYSHLGYIKPHTFTYVDEYCLPIVIEYQKNKNSIKIGLNSDSNIIFNYLKKIIDESQKFKNFEIFDEILIKNPRPGFFGKRWISPQ